MTTDASRMILAIRSQFRNATSCMTCPPQLICTFLVAVLMLVAPAASHAQQAPQPQPSVQKTLQPIIADISIRGLQRIEALSILYQLDLAIGDRYDETVANDALKKIIGTQLFDNASIGMEGDILIVQLQEAPVIYRINYEGNSAIKDDDLEHEIDISSRQPLNRSKVAKAVRRLLAIYQATGYFRATVQPKIIRRDQNRVDLIFDINEGNQGTIRSIRFLGNKAFSDEQLRNEVTSRQGRWYVAKARKSYDPNRINFDRGQLRNFYLKRGFLKFSVRDTLVELHPNREDFLLTFLLDEGDRYSLRSTTMRSQIPELDLTDIDLLAAKSFKIGRYYDIDDIESFENKVKQLSEDQGFYPVEVTLDSSIDDKEGVVDLAFSVILGQRLTIGEVRIIGNIRTEDSVIRRSLFLAEGELVRQENVEKSRSSLLALGYFESVEIQLRPGEGSDGYISDQIIVEIIVEEKATGSVRFGAGYNSAYGLQGTVGFSENNLTGKGYQVNAEILVAQRLQNYTLSFTNPFINNIPLSLGGDVFSTTNSSIESGYVHKSQGARFRLGYPLGNKWRQSFRLEASRKKITNPKTLATPYLKTSLGKFDLYGIGHTLRLRTVDNSTHPHSGILATFDVDVFGLSNRVGYFRTVIDTNIFVPVTSNSTLLIKNEVGYVHSLLSNQPVNITDRFFAGGSTLPRGFVFSGIGPRDKKSSISLGGNFSWTSTLEYEFLFGVPVDLGIYALLFLDAGTVLLNDDRVIAGNPIQTSSIIRSSGGFGFRWYSPFAPFTLTFAWPFTKASHDITQVFGFSLSAGL